MNPQTATNTEYFESRAHITLWASIKSGDAGEHTDQPRLFDGTSALLTEAAVTCEGHPLLRGLFGAWRAPGSWNLGRLWAQTRRWAGWAPGCPSSASHWNQESTEVMRRDWTSPRSTERMQEFFLPRRRGPNGLRAFVLRQIQDSARKHQTTPHYQTQVYFFWDFWHPETGEPLKTNKNNKHKQTSIGFVQ